MEVTTLARLRTQTEVFYREQGRELLFHGWHHIFFVSKKTVEITKATGADAILAESAALVHDLNYAVERNSAPGAGEALRARLLREAGYDEATIARIEMIVHEADIAVRTATITPEGAALSDADTLFKALPITPIIFAGKYITENNVDVAKLAQKVVGEQQPLMEQGIYFYTDYARERWMAWAQANLTLWLGVKEALQDEDVRTMLKLMDAS